MKRLLLIAGLIFLNFSDVCFSQDVGFNCKIIQNLTSQDYKVLKQTFQELGIERDLVGFSKIQILYSYVENDKSSFFIAVLSWEAPMGGYIILLKPNGKILAKTETGYIKNLSLRPLKRSDPDKLIVDAIVGTGSGMRLDKFTIFSINNNSLKTLWEGLSYEKSAPGLVSPDDNYELKGSLKFEDLNNDEIEEIIYSVKRKQYSYDSKASKWTSHEATEKIEYYDFKEGTICRRKMK